MTFVTSNASGNMKKRTPMWRNHAGEMPLLCGTIELLDHVTSIRTYLRDSRSYTSIAQISLRTRLVALLEKYKVCQKHGRKASAFDPSYRPHCSFKHQCIVAFSSNIARTILYSRLKVRRITASAFKIQRLSLGLASMFNLPKLMPFLPLSSAPPNLGILLPTVRLFVGEGASAVFSHDLLIRCFFAFG